MAYESTATVTPSPSNGISELDGHRITRTPDGQIVVEGPGVVTARIPQKGDFDENLAEFMTSSERRLLADRLNEFCQVDKTSRKDWERREKKAMEMLGLKDAENTDNEEIGHNVTHPMLMEATTRFQANAIVEMFPPSGPAETKVVGKQTAPKMARAARVRKFLNHYLTDVDDGYFNDTDKMLMYLPMGGSAFRRAGQDFTTGLPILRHVVASRFIAPYAGTDLKSMPRYAWEFTMTGEDIERSMQIGMFIDENLPQPPLGEATHAQSSDTSDMRQPAIHDRDRVYQMLEYHIDLELLVDNQGRGNLRRMSDDTGLRPYIVVMDASNATVLMVRRNWKKTDRKHAKRIWFAHHQFLPGLGFYGWGYPHVIGSLGQAASGAVNALLDAALAANFQGGFVTKEAKISGEFRLEHGVWQQCDSSGEDLAKSFYTPPFKEPSPALFQLLEGLVEAGQRYAGTTDSAVGDGNNTGPVGTTVALIEQAQKPINAIHKRLHVSMSQELTMLCALIEDFMPARYDYNIGDEQQFLLKADFAPGVGVVCVTDPNVSSDTQRVMRAQAVIQLQKEEPEIYPPQAKAEAHRRMLVALKTPNIDAIAPVVKTPQYLDAVAENAMIFAGNPVRVFPTQDDQAHLAIHQDGLQRAQALFPPDVFEKLIAPAMQVHIRDHMAKSYIKQMLTAAGIPPNFDADGNPQGLAPQIENQITARVAAILERLPHPQPKAGTPNAAEQAAQAEIAFKQQQRQAQVDQDEQAFQASERRKQAAFDNEERRKDQAMDFQEGRIAVAGAHKAAIGAAAADDQRQRSEAEHVQRLTQGAQDHAEGQRRAAESHQQSLEQSAAEAAAAGGGDEVAAGDKVAQAAAGEEAGADSHTGVG